MTMDITGDMLIGSHLVQGREGCVTAYSPVLGRYLEPLFSAGGRDDVDRACQLAAAAFDPYRNAPLEKRAQLLEAIAQGLLDLGEALIERAHLETALPVARLTGERLRTVNQLKLFAEVVREGAWQDLRIDPAQPERTPPRVDLRLQKIALGPVAVFGASNFPLAFSVAGGDTASALAAGCPVVVKAHPAHLGTSELVGRVIRQAVADCGLPEGVFSLLIDADTRLGAALVAHPAIQAVGFTGSRHGGLALQAIAQARPQPIPVYAEMSAINPVLLLPNALKEGGAALAVAFADSLTLGVGQFCTNPGLLLAVRGPELEAFIAAASEALREKSAGTMLTPAIATAYAQAVDAVAATPGVHTRVSRAASDAAGQGRAALFQTDADTFLADAGLEREMFGPAALIVECADDSELLSVLEHLSGQLTATLQLSVSDQAFAQRLLPVLERKAGRILVNGWPTGVEVCSAMVHGGPFPATSSPLFSSVGTTAIERFLRPVCYQNFPHWLLPPALAQRS
jgi:alpha-ketoglutaric semialdehyde dehydrogenase